MINDQWSLRALLSFANLLWKGFRLHVVKCWSADIIRRPEENCFVNLITVQLTQLIPLMLSLLHLEQIGWLSSPQSGVEPACIPCPTHPRTTVNQPTEEHFGLRGTYEVFTLHVSREVRYREENGYISGTDSWWSHGHRTCNVPFLVGLRSTLRCVLYVLLRGVEEAMYSDRKLILSWRMSDSISREPCHVNEKDETIDQWCWPRLLQRSVPVAVSAEKSTVKKLIRGNWKKKKYHVVGFESHVLRTFYWRWQASSLMRGQYNIGHLNQWISIL